MGGTGGADANEGGGDGGEVGNDAGQSDTSAETPDASGPDGARTSCAGGAIALHANVPTNRDPAMARMMVDFGNSPELPVGDSPRTVELWAFVESTSWAGDANTIFEDGLVKPTTRPGHTRASGTLMAASPDQLPAWISSTAPIGCP